MANELGFLTFDDLRGGRNGVDTPLAVPEVQCVEAINVDFYNARLGRRRKGAIVYSPAPGATLQYDIRTLIRHQPFGRETNNELWAIDSELNAARLVNNVWASMGPLPDRNLTDSDYTRVHWASFNNKLFLAYGSGTANGLDRMHVYDPLSGTVRKAGLPAGTILTPTANAGTGITGTRFYRVAFTQKIGGVVVRRGEQSDFKGLAITNQGGWIVKYGVLPGEGETHWEVYGAIQGTVAGTFAGWYFISDLPLATTQFVDTTPPASWPPPAAPLAPQIGSNSPLPSAKFLLVDEARLLLAGWWPTAPVGTNSYESRVWWTPILYDASQVANDEHINLYLNPYIDFDPGDGGEITGLGGPLFDCPYVFKYNRIYKMARTGLPDAPYRPVTVSKACGCIHQRTIVRGEDENGAEALYFLSKRGPYRIGAQGLQYLGRDIEDLWRKVNLDKIAGGPFLTTGWASAHGIYHQEMHQIWWYLPTTQTVPSMKIVFDVRLGKFTDVDGVRGGWSQHLGASCEAWASALFSAAWDGTNFVNGVNLKPFISQSGNSTSPSAFAEAIEGLPIEPRAPDPMPKAPRTPIVWQCDVDNLYVDVLDKFACRLTTRAVPISGTVALHGGVIEGHLLGCGILGAPALTIYTCRDFFAELRAATPVTLPQMATITRTLVPVRDLGAASAAALQILIVDLGTSGFGWHLDQLVLRINKQEDR